MKLIILISAVLLSACSHRAIVEDCQDITGTDLKNCRVLKLY